MLWLVNKESSHEIISCNIHDEAGVHQLWVTRPNGKSIKIRENEDRAIVAEVKECIDYAIENKESALRLD